MPPLSLGSKQITGTRARVNSGGFDDNMPVFDKFLNVRAGVGVADFGLFCGVEPDFTLADARDSRGEPLLRTEIDWLLGLRD
jgi:hypothetical protein